MIIVNKVSVPATEAELLEAKNRVARARIELRAASFDLLLKVSPKNLELAKALHYEADLTISAADTIDYKARLAEDVLRAREEGAR